MQLSNSFFDADDYAVLQAYKEQHPEFNLKNNRTDYTIEDINNK